MKFNEFLNELETKVFSTLKSVIKAKTDDIIKFLDKNATAKGRESWLIMGPNTKICLVAHIDTVFREIQKKEVLNKKGVWTSPQGIGGDDRCGVYGIINIWRTLPADKRPILLFTDKEETGAFGAREAAQKFGDYLKDVNFFVELDRRGEDDMVFYNDESPEFQGHIERYGFKKSHGSFSDITILGRHFKKSSVNVSVGYYNQHTQREFIIVKQLLATIGKVKNMCTVNDIPKYDLPIPFPQYVERMGSKYSGENKYFPRKGQQGTFGFKVGSSSSKSQVIDRSAEGKPPLILPGKSAISDDEKKRLRARQYAQMQQAKKSGATALPPPERITKLSELVRDETYLLDKGTKVLKVKCIVSGPFVKEIELSPGGKRMAFNRDEDLTHVKLYKRILKPAVKPTAGMQFTDKDGVLWMVDYVSDNGNIAMRYKIDEENWSISVKTITPAQLAANFVRSGK